MREEAVYEGVEAVDALVARLVSEGVGRVFLLFTGNYDEHGDSWCPDCNRCKPALKEFSQECLWEEDALVTCGVGERDEWKRSDNKFRTAKGIKAVPTLVNLATGETLVEGEVASKEKLRSLFAPRRYGEEYIAEGVSKLEDKLAGLKATSGRVFVFYVGNWDTKQQSWCSDCNQSLPLIRKHAKALLEAGDNIIICGVGEKDEWRGCPENEFRLKRDLALIPTLTELASGRLLVEGDCSDQNLLREMFSKRSIRELTVRGLAALQDLLTKLSDENDEKRRVFVVYVGNMTDGVSWCSDCVQAYPQILRYARANLGSSDVFITCEVGDKAGWKDPANEFRVASEGKRSHVLTAVPTLVEISTERRLVEESCLGENLLRQMFQNHASSPETAQAD